MAVCLTESALWALLLHSCLIEVGPDARCLIEAGPCCRTRSTVPSAQRTSKTVAICPSLYATQRHRAAGDGWIVLVTCPRATFPILSDPGSQMLMNQSIGQDRVGDPALLETRPPKPDGLRHLLCSILTGDRQERWSSRCRGAH